MALRNARFADLILTIFLITLALAGCIGAEAQSQSAAESAGFTRTARLKEGTEVRPKLRDKLTSKTAVEGDPVNLMLDQDLRVGNITVAKAGGSPSARSRMRTRLAWSADLEISACGWST
jgi:hypothetical protein